MTEYSVKQLAQEAPGCEELAQYLAQRRRLECDDLIETLVRIVDRENSSGLVGERLVTDGLHIPGTRAHFVSKKFLLALIPQVFGVAFAEGADMRDSAMRALLVSAWNGVVLLSEEGQALFRAIMQFRNVEKRWPTESEAVAIDAKHSLDELIGAGVALKEDGVVRAVRWW